MTIHSRHTLASCKMCGVMVRCAVNNNCCNATYGEVDGRTCSACPEAYDHQDAFLKDGDSVRFARDERA